MSPSTLAALAAVGFIASALGAVTGGNSLHTVPALMMAGMGAQQAVATNMLAVTFLSAGASLRFLRAGVIPRYPTVGLLASAVPGSILGAWLALRLSPGSLSTIISIAMLAMVALLAFEPRAGTAHKARSRLVRGVGYGLLAVWGIYGGLFSGGYTTVLTIACVWLFGVTLVESIGLTKVVNFFSSAAATAIFALEGRIDWTLGLVLSGAMALGGWAGATWVVRADVRRVRWVFLVAVTAMAVKLIVEAT